VTVSTDGKLAFVANYGAREPGSTISVIDLAARKELHRLDLGALRRPHGIEFRAGKVYFTAELAKVVARYDPAAERVDWILGTGQNGTHMLVLNKDASKIFTANIGSDSVTAIELTSTGWNEIMIPVGKGPEGIDWSPDGNQVWTAHSRDGGVSIIDAHSNKVIETLDARTRRSNRLKFTADGKRVLISDLAGGELVVLDAASRKQIKRLKLGRSPAGILVPANGSAAYIAVSGDDKIAVINLKTLEITSSIETGSGPDGMAWLEGH
jgi:YVTN family beta-propeller protein